MGFFYFDETIQEKGGFIIGAFVYSELDLSPKISDALKSVGMTPMTDEFKSGAHMGRYPKQAQLRETLISIFSDTKIGLLVMPVSSRDSLGDEAINALIKILAANRLSQKQHVVYLDTGIPVSGEASAKLNDAFPNCCQINIDQDSKIIGGIQLADLAAHSLGSMLLEKQGHISKKIKAGENSGYDPDTEIELGFYLWTPMRYSFFGAPKEPLNDEESNMNEFLTRDVENFGLYISPLCNKELHDEALITFGESYLGCLH